MEFRCRLGTPAGQLIDGVYAAESEAQLRREFEEKGLLLLSVRPAGILATLVPSLASRRRVRTRDFLEFCQELATLLKAGMPLVQSLDLLRRDIADAAFKPIVDNVYERVKAGAQLSDAFEEHGDLVPRMFTASLVAGERSGNLETVIRRYVAYARLIGGVRRRTLSALLYPAVLLCLATVVVSVIVLWLVPAFSQFYDSFGAELPLMTRIIVGLANGVQVYLPFIVLALACVGVVAWTTLKRPAERQATRSRDPGLSAGGRHRAQVRDVADGANARDAARWRHPAGPGARRSVAVSGEPVRRRRTATHCRACT